MQAVEQIKECFVGIDVSKSTLDVDAYPTANPVSFANDEAGRSDALAALRKLHPTLLNAMIKHDKPWKHEVMKSALELTKTAEV